VFGRKTADHREAAIKGLNVPSRSVAWLDHEISASLGSQD
jgi:hypothetical protein